jgi:hypothetical protein
MSQTAVKMIATGTADPSAIPAADAPQVAILADVNGVPYSKIVIVDDAPLTGVANDAPIDPSALPINLPCVSFLYSLDPVNNDWIGVLNVVNNADAIAPSAVARAFQVANYNYLFDGTNFNRARGAANNASLAAAATAANAQVVAFNYGLGGNDATFARFRIADATQVAKLSGDGAQMVERPGSWAIFHAPAVGVVATISRAAGAAGVRHVCDSISFTVNAVAAITVPVVVNLRDGATGAGTILRSWRVTAPVGTTYSISETGLNLVGTAATAMTLEFAAAPAGTDFQNVNLAGHDVSG